MRIYVNEEHRRAVTHTKLLSLFLVSCFPAFLIQFFQ